MNRRSEDPNSLRNEVFSRIFDENWAAVRHHIECVVSDDAEVTELVSEVFLVAWTRLDHSKPMGRVWLLRAADRTLRERSGRPTMRRTAVDAVQRGLVGAGERTDQDMQTRVLKALDVLKCRDRRIIILAYWDGLSVGEIAELLRRPRSWIRAALHRAKRRVGKELGLEGRAEDDG